MNAKYSIGQRVFAGTTRQSTEVLPCPDCVGKRTWQAILPNGETLTIGCPTCDAWGSTGVVKRYRCAPATMDLTIGSIRIDTADAEGPQYMCEETGIGSGTLWRESRLHLTEAAALEAGVVLAREMNQNIDDSYVQNLINRRKKAGRMTAYLRSKVTDLRKQIEQIEARIVKEKV